MTTPQPNQFLVQPINDFDLIVVFRGSDISRPLYMTYRDLLAILTAAISGGGTSGLLLQTNGVTNPIQDVLNILEGTGMSIVDNGDGSVTFNATGGGSVTADNGLTETSGNVQLGSTVSGGAPLLHNTYIDTLVNHTLYLEGQKTSPNDFILDVDNSTADGGAIKASALGSGNAIRATSISASALAANSSAAAAIAATTGGANEAGLFTNSDTGTNNIVQGIKLRHSSSGVPAVGFGVAADFTGKTTLNSDLRLGRLIYQWTNAITSNRTSKFQVETVNSGVASVKTEINGNGQLTLNLYGVNTFTGTPAYYLGVDASGNVIEVTPSGGGGSLLNDTTGILFGGVLSATIGGTTFSVTAGIGQIVTQTASISGVVTTVTNVTWSAVVGAAITNIATSQFTYVLVNSSGVVIQQTTPFTDAQYKTHIIIGILCHIDLASVNLVTNAQNVAYEDPHRLVELISAFGPIKKSGLNISANGANLRVNRALGEAFKIGSNYITDQFEPDVRTIAAETPALLCRVHRNGSGGFIFDVNGGLYYNDIDPNQYDNGSGTLDSVGGSKWTIQRLFFFPNNPADIICYYGTQVYNQFSEARANLEFETFDEAQITAENAVFLGFLFVRNAATDLSDPNEAAFLQSGLFRGIPAGGGGSGGGGGGITSLNAQTGATQTFANGTSGTAPAFVSALDVHTLDIPLASTVGVTAGLVSYNQIVRYDNASFPVVEREFTSSTTAAAIIKIPSSNVIFVAYTGTGSVVAYNSATSDILSTTILAGAIGLVYVALTGEVWAFSSAASITRFTATTGVSLGATAIAGLTASCRGVYDDSLVTGNVFAYNGTTMNVLNATTYARTGVAIGGGSGSNELTLVTSGVQAGLLVGTVNIGVFGFNKATNTLAYAPINIGGYPYIKWVDSLGVFVASSAALNRVSFVIPSTATTITLSTALNGIQQPNQFEFDETENRLYVASSATGTAQMRIAIIELTTLTWVKSVIITAVTTNGQSFTAIDKANKTLFAVGVAAGGSINKIIYA